MEPREFVDQELNLISATFAVQKGLNPMVVLIKDDQRYAIPVQYQNAAHKDIVSQGIKDLVKTSQPDIVVYMAEAWIKIIKGRLDRLPESIHPEDFHKEEIVAVQIEFKSGEKFGCEAKILRDKGIPRLDKFEIRSSDYTLGRFVDFFPIKWTS
jgi:hypothetical protein